MNSLAKIFLLVSIVCNYLQSVAQDVHLTQFYTSNISLNPAFTGHYDGDIKATLNARTQWSQFLKAVKTTMFSVEKKYFKHLDEVGVGLIVVNDFFNPSMLNSNKIQLAASYQRDFSKNKIRVGLSGGPTLKAIDLSKQTTPDQWNYPVGEFDKSIPMGEAGINGNWGYADLNFGLGYSRTFYKWKVDGGYGIFHLNRPKEKFTSNSLNVPMRHVFNVGVIRNLTKTLWISPQLLFMKNARATDILFVLKGNKRLNKSIVVEGGTAYRGSPVNSDAAMAVVGLHYERFFFGLSRDFIVSDLKKGTNNKHAWEIAITYITPSRAPGKITVPCDRY